MLAKGGFVDLLLGVGWWIRVEAVDTHFSKEFAKRNNINNLQ